MRPAERPDPIELVGDEERCDPTYERYLTEQAHERWEDERSQRDAVRRARRESLRPGARLDIILTVVANFQGGRVLQVAQEGGRSSEEGIGPPPADTLDVSHHTDVILARVREIEREVDRYLGVSATPALSMLGAREKDKLIVERFRGWRPEDVSEAHPELGSARTIRRVRSNAGFRGVDGTPKPEPKPQQRRPRAA